MYYFYLKKFTDSRRVIHSILRRENNGVKFSSYACTAIIHGFIGELKSENEKKQRIFEKFLLDFSEVGESINHLPNKKYLDAKKNTIPDREEIKKVIDSTRLTSRERAIIDLRFPFSGEERKTLEITGKVTNISKERARQVQNNALKKLRERAELIF